jgi:Ca2+-binding RTX toxin-like protein
MKIDINYMAISACTGNDQLKGGEGVDVYQFTSTYGTDTIIDSDGKGVIMVEGVQLMGGKKIAEGVYYNETTNYTYTLTGTAGNQTLIIHKDGEKNQVVETIKPNPTKPKIGISKSLSIKFHRLLNGFEMANFSKLQKNYLQTASANDNEWRVVA